LRLYFDSPWFYFEGTAAVNSNIKALLRRGRGYRNLNYLLLKGQRMAAARTEFVGFQKAA
jgi:hypothetical protein